MARAYRLGRRQDAVDRTAAGVLDAARELVAEGARTPSAQAIANRAGVSRVTVYNRFGSVRELLGRLGPEPAALPAEGGAREALHSHLRSAAAAWALRPALYRNLPRTPEPDPEALRRLVERLSAEDALRPGCSLKEAEDVIGILSSFHAFDRLHRDGRRSPAAVADILMRLASVTLA